MTDGQATPFSHIAAAFFCGIVGGFAASVVIMTLIGETRPLFQKEAIEAGAAYWTIDSQTGEREFKWRMCDGEEAALIKKR